ncbi:microcin immunity protein [Serratia rubidaea]|uniref:microcin immunity protein n=1 Tax=Serratia rubidaea TaxID=61652 RepID=UPI002432DC96|nr:microcin immunity protein [Serratia rubidaea]MCR0999337.1 microcin immunity protein [Serratia rubidaea]
MRGEGNFHWLDKFGAILSAPLTILFVSLSSLKIIGEENSFIDVFLSVVIFIGFFGSFKIVKRVLTWFFSNVK